MLVCNDGNIGAGKSTLMTLLEKQGHKVVLEGIDRSTWGTLLDDYYHADSAALGVQRAAARNGRTLYNTAVGIPGSTFVIAATPVVANDELPGTVWTDTRRN
eukprot:COSAG05_NODE_2569_length_2888_cov_1.738975_1_plen_102_part_00